MSQKCTPAAGVTSLSAVRDYWDVRVHDTVLSHDPPGSAGYFAAMAEYRYSKLAYVPDLVGFDRWRGKDVLDIGCGAGLDLVRLAAAGARPVGVEISGGSLDLARQYLATVGLQAKLVQADAGRLPFRDSTFDLVLCHGVLPFAPDPVAIVRECRRVLRDDGLAIVVAYNRVSIMSALRTISAVAPGHGDAPVFRTFTVREFDRLLEPFARRDISTERFGWHLVACCRAQPESATGTP